MHLLRFSFVSMLLSGICLAPSALAQLSSPQPVDTPAPARAVATPRSPRTLEADRLFEQAQGYGLSPEESSKQM
jgi:hypothetical protein